MDTYFFITAALFTAWALKTNKGEDEINWEFGLHSLSVLGLLGMRQAYPEAEIFGQLMNILTGIYTIGGMILIYKRGK